MHILVTGGAGYIGSHVVKQLLENTEHDITILDNLVTGFAETIKSLQAIDNRFHFIHADLSEWKAIETLFCEKRFDAVIHFAASLIVPESVENPLKYYLNNTANTTHLLKQCTLHGINRFIFSSTAAVYGEPSQDEIPIKETNQKFPINPYGMSKLMSESIIQDTAKAHENFKFVILRYFNVAGADIHNRIGECHEPETHLIPLIAKTALGKRDKIFIYGDNYNTSDGTCIRDYIHIEDLASAHIQALNYLDQNKSDIFNCGYGHGFSVKEVINTMREVSGADFTADIRERRAGDPAILISDNAKIKEKMGWNPRYDDLRLICKTALEWEKKI